MNESPARAQAASTPDTLGPVLHPLIFPLAVLGVGLVLQRLAPLPALPRGLALAPGLVALVYPALALLTNSA